MNFIKRLQPIFSPFLKRAFSEEKVDIEILHPQERGCNSTSDVTSYARKSDRNRRILEAVGPH